MSPLTRSATPAAGESGYRAEIDGLRAIAVIAVVLYHAGGFLCGGGYVGVDVFFVISGFLITSSIWKDLESGRFTFAHFWERRARRIIPALAVMTIATLAAGWFLLLPSDYESLGLEAAALAGFATNFYYWRHSGYFAGVSDDKPLLHTWSLAVEEQFYLLVPLALWTIFRVTALRRRMAAILAMGLVLSLALSVYGVMEVPSATFYLLPTRAWELLLGAILPFLSPHLPLAERPRLREFLAAAGASLILVPVFLYSADTPFPGLAALPPCLGALLIIWTNERTGTRLPTAVGAALSLRPFVFIGLISYSLYLWHWPLLAFRRYALLGPRTAGDGLAIRAAIVGLSFLAAVLSWKYVETPVRARRVGASRKSLFVFAGTGMAIVAVGGLLCAAMQGFPSRFPARVQEIANAASDKAFSHNLTPNDARAGRFIRIGVANPALRPAVFVWGDSHAMAAMPALDALLQERGLAGRAATHSVTAPLLQWFKTSKFGLSEDSVAFNDAVFSHIRNERIPTVILIASWTDYSGDPAFDAALSATIRQLVAAGAQPWVMLSVPEHTFNVPRTLARAAATDEDPRRFSTATSPGDQFDLIDSVTIADVMAAGGRVIDPKPRFLDSAGQRYVAMANGVVLYRDHHHLTTRGARLILLPLFRESLSVRPPRGSLPRRAAPAG